MKNKKMGRLLCLLLFCAMLFACEASVDGGIGVNADDHESSVQEVNEATSRETAGSRNESSDYTQNEEGELVPWFDVINMFYTVLRFDCVVDAKQIDTYIGAERITLAEVACTVLFAPDLPLAHWSEPFEIGQQITVWLPVASVEEALDSSAVLLELKAKRFAETSRLLPEGMSASGEIDWILFEDDCLLLDAEKLKIGQGVYYGLHSWNVYLEQLQRFGRNDPCAALFPENKLETGDSVETVVLFLQQAFHAVINYEQHDDCGY